MILTFPGGISEEDLPKIEKLMKEEVKANLPFNCQEQDAKGATEFFQKQGEKYKVELIKGLGSGKVSIYKHGQFRICVRALTLNQLGR